MNNFLKHFIDIGFGTVISVLLGFFTTPLITRIIDPVEFGKFNLFNTYAGLILSFVYFGLDQALIRFFYSKNSEKERISILKLCIVIPCVTGLLILIVLRLLLVFNVIKNSLFSLIFIYLFVNVIISIWNKMSMILLRLTYQSKIYSLCTVMQKVVYCVAILLGVFVFKTNNMYILIIATILSIFAASLISTLSTKKYWNFKDINYPENTNEMLKYSLPFVIFAFVITLIDSSDILFVEHYCSDYELGVYSSAFTLIGILAIIQTTFNTLWIPAQTQQFLENPEDKTFIRKGNLYMTIIMVFLTINVIMFKDVICYILGKSYRGAAEYLPFLLINTTMCTLVDTTSSGIDYSKKSYLYIVCAILPCILGIVTQFILVPIIGAKGAAIGRCVSGILYFILRTYFSNKYYYVDYSLKRLSICVLMMVVFAIIDVFTRITIIQIIVYLICLVIFILMYIKDIKDMIDYFKGTLFVKKQ